MVDLTRRHAPYGAVVSARFSYTNVSPRLSALGLRTHSVYRDCIRWFAGPERRTSGSDAQYALSVLGRWEALLVQDGAVVVDGDDAPIVHGVGVETDFLHEPLVESFDRLAVLLPVRGPVTEFDQVLGHIVFVNDPVVDQVGESADG